MRFGHTRNLGVLYAAQRPLVVARRLVRSQALRAKQSQRSSSLRPGVSNGGRFAPACCAAQSVCGRAAYGRTGLFCRRRARGARERQRFVCQRRCQCRCGRGLTGRSTGGATAGRLARATPFVYPAPRGQGGLPRHPGYLYVRPRGRHGPGSTCCQRASVSLANPKRTRTEQLPLVELPSFVSISGASRRARPSFSVGAPKGQQWLALRAGVLRRAVSQWAHRTRTAWFALPSRCTRRERAAASRLESRYKRSCGRGLTGQSTGGATAGRLARVAQLAYPPPRGQGVLPRLPGYLYVRPRRRQKELGCNELSARFGHFRTSVRIQRAKPVAVALRCRKVQALRAGQGQRFQWQRPRVSSGWRFAPACCAAQSVCGRATHGTPDLLCRRRARGARKRQRFRCQLRCQRRCGRGLTGRSTGGATAGRLARVAQLAYPPPRGQGSLPRPPGYLYVRPRWRQCSAAANHQ